MTSMSIRDLRRRLRARLPKAVFAPQPLRGIAAYAEIALALGIGTLMARGHLPWWANLGLALLLGQLAASVAFLAHEAMHLSVFRSRRANEVLGAVGFAPFFLPPGLWHAWHVQGHHGNTNRPHRDPDRLLSVEEYRTSWVARMKTRLSLGGRRLLPVLALTFTFTFQGQAFLWVHCDDPELADRLHMNRLRQRVLSSLQIAAWLALSIWLGWVAIYIVLIPMMTANVTFMVYISTQHWLRPLVHEDNPIFTTLSVQVPKFFDWIHFGFSYHQEHHVFPRMSHKFGPQVREAMREVQPEAIALLPLTTALRQVFVTPSLYDDEVTRTHEDQSGAVDLGALAKRLDLPSHDTDTSDGAPQKQSA